jgi:Asp/Glu/hydantoin racemase
MTRKIIFIHTLPSLVEPFTELADEILPEDVKIMHIADEILLKVVLAQGGLSPFIHHRLAEHVIAAQQAGADVVQLTCSSISPCADSASPMVGIPVLKIDEPMVDKAISIGERIGVAATAPTTLKPTTEMVTARAKVIGKDVKVESVLCEGAYDALFSGDQETHDNIVRDNLQQLMKRNDVILLAQASMARVVETIPADERIVPILSSPLLAVERARDVINSVSE